MSSTADLKDLPADFYKHRPPRWKYGFIWKAARYGASMGKHYPHVTLDEIADAVVDEMLFHRHGAPMASLVLGKKSQAREPKQ